MSGVTIISSRWGDMKDKRRAEDREEELKISYWKEWTDRGCHIKRFHDSYQSACEIIRDIVCVPLALHLPRELATNGSPRNFVDDIPLMHAQIKNPSGNMFKEDFDIHVCP